MDHRTVHFTTLLRMMSCHREKHSIYQKLVSSSCSECMIKSRMTGDCHVRLCVQQRLVCSAGVSPARIRTRGPIAWMAGTRETDCLKPIDKAIQRDVSESSGHNESERIGGLESENPRRPSFQP